MLTHEPTTWTDALFVLGTKNNLLQDGYNPKLHVSAVSLGSSVVITRHQYIDTARESEQGVVDQPIESLTLYDDEPNSSKARYRLVAWSQGTIIKSLLAISMTTRLDIWEVAVSSGICANLKSSLDINHLQGISWNPCYEVLLAYSTTGISVVDASGPLLSSRQVYADTETHQSWSASSWSPCGLHVSLARNRTLHCFGWKDVDCLLCEQPAHGQFDVGTLESIDGFQIEVGKACAGQIAAIARVSPTVCIFTTDAKLILEDATQHASSLLLFPDSTHRVEIRETTDTSVSDIIDLTSKRIMSGFTSTTNSLQILNHAEGKAPYQTSASHAIPRSQMWTLGCTSGRWFVMSILDLPNLTSPDVFAVQERVAIVGSTMSSRLLFAHLNNSDPLEWTPSLYGELDLPTAHVCRGIRFTENSLYVDVASTEKRKRTSFFQAAASLEPQPVYLSKFRVPQYILSKAALGPTSKLPNVTAFAGNDTPSSFSDDNCDASTHTDLLELIVVKMTAMQAQLNSRFDHVDKKLLQLTARVEQLEKNGGESVK